MRSSRPGALPLKDSELQKLRHKNTASSKQKQLKFCSKHTLLPNKDPENVICQKIKSISELSSIFQTFAILHVKKGELVLENQSVFCHNNIASLGNQVFPTCFSL